LFRGVNAVNLDAKGRMAVPVRYRSELEADAGSQLIVTIDMDDPCLLLYPLPEWEVIEQKVEGLPSLNRAARRIQRLLIGHATEVEIDNHGRILLPILLREYAQLDKQVILVGQGRKFEVWADLLWQEGRNRWIAGKGEEGADYPAELCSFSL
jgi:MraZ protein